MAEHAHLLEMRKLELQVSLERERVQGEKEIRLRQLELETAARSQQSTESGECLSGAINVRKYLGFVPPFDEADVDLFFSTFERTARAMRWPQEAWPILL